jgi:hypothetical protein
MSTLPLRALLIVATVLVLAGAAASWIADREIDKTRQDLVERRLETALDILRAPAAAALSSHDALPAFIEDLNNWGRVTGLRLTLILPDGMVLADTEVKKMPNLADRPEVRAASAGRIGSASRRSAVTGKDSFYVATPIEKDGVRIGTLRAVTDTSEIGGTLAGLERTFAIFAAGCLVAGTIIGTLLGRSTSLVDDGAESEPHDEQRRAA